MTRAMKGRLIDRVGPAMRLVSFSVVLLLSSACGAPRAVIAPAEGGEASACAPPEGSFIGESTLRFKEGSCTAAKPHSRDRMDFDDGAFVSPAAALVPCTTEVRACALTISCEVLGLRLVFEGEVSGDGQRITGVATFTGSADGCTRAVYDVEATRPLP